HRPAHARRRRAGNAGRRSRPAAPRAAGACRRGLPAPAKPSPWPPPLRSTRRRASARFPSRSAQQSSWLSLGRARTSGATPRPRDVFLIRPPTWRVFTVHGDTSPTPAEPERPTVPWACTVRFLRRGSSTTDTKDAEATDTGEESAQSHIRRGYTPKKGRPTPSRREAENKRRGPVPPPPNTTREAIKRSRELRKSNPVSKEELKALRRERRERMLAGDERYLAPHDRGPVKAFARDCVDSRRNLLGLFMPLALVM